MVVVSTRRSIRYGVLGETSGLLGTSGVPNELAGLCALLGNQQSHNVSLTNLQVVELQRAVAAQKLAMEKQAAAAVQAKIDEKVAEELKKVAPSNLPVQPEVDSLKRRKTMGTATCCHLKAHRGEQSMLSEPKTSSRTKKRMRLAMALQGNSMGRVAIQVKMIRVEQDVKIINQWS